MCALEHEIDIQPPEKTQNPDLQLPVNIIAVGNVNSDDTKIYILQSVFNEIEAASAKDTDHEMGGFLFGGYLEEYGKLQVVISRYIRAEHTDASKATLTFTHESWDDIHAQHQAQCAELMMVGWQHTHPGYGIFLSGYDMFIQENFFNIPFNVAYVVDPVNQSRGFFQWKNEKVQPTGGFYIYDDINTAIKAPKEKDPALYKAHGGIRILPTILILALFLISAAVGLYALSLNRKIADLNVDLSAAENKLAAVELISVSQNVSIETLKSKLQTLETNAASAKEPAPNSNLYFIEYTVKPGDSLIGICSTHNLNFSKYKKIIISVNGIKDSGRIYSGQLLLLPSANPQ